MRNVFSRQVSKELLAGDSTTQVAVILIGVVLVLAVAAVIGFHWWKWKRDS